LDKFIALKVEMNILFRLDANNTIGSGHFSRCLTIADSLIEQDCSCTFMTRNLPENFKKILKKKKIKNLNNDSAKKELEGDLPHSNWLESSQKNDAEVFLEMIKDNYDWLIVDHYALDYRWESYFLKVAKNILVIDDLADRKHECDILIDANISENKRTFYESNTPSKAKIFLGQKFALIRPEFIAQKLKNIESIPKKILIFFGGFDEKKLTLKTLRTLVKIDTKKEFNFEVVVGANNKNKKQIFDECQKIGAEYHEQINNISYLMAKSSISIGAGGTTVWERSYMGLPTLAFSIASNQLEQVEKANSLKILHGINYEGLSEEQFEIELKNFLKNTKLHKILKNKSQNFIDGLGVKRITALMKSRSITIREAIISDLENIYNWRNDPQTRKFSNDPSPISLESHKEWFEKTLKNKNKIILIISFNKIPIGVVRFDCLNKSEAEVSIYLVPNNKKAAGMGRYILLKAERWLKENVTNIDLLKATVSRKNLISQQMFKNACYTYNDDIYVKNLK
tara:strand:+ start:11023 stop:12558 length:1536 start_codon:yes stop_codon:yes gene_type:complete